MVTDMKTSPECLYDGWRAMYISLTFLKESGDTKLGLHLDEDNLTGDVYISSFSSQGILTNTALRVGDKLAMINDIPCSNMGKHDLIAFIRLLSGKVTLVVRDEKGHPGLLESIVHKPSASSKVGVTVRCSSGGVVKVTKLHPGRLLSNSLLALNDRIIKINGHDCQTLDSTKIKSLLNDSLCISFLAEPPEPVLETSPPPTPVETDSDTSNLDEIKAMEDCPNGPVVVRTNLSDALSPILDWNVDVQKTHPISTNTSKTQSFSEYVPSKMESETNPESDEETELEDLEDITIKSSESGKNKLAPVEVKKTEEDMYGQQHPIESPELIAYKLQELSEEVELIPAEKKTHLLMAEERCPELLTPAFKLIFLRCDTFKAKKAAKRMAEYWESRVTVFGHEVAFKPLTIANCLKEEDYHYFCGGVASVIELGDRTGVVSVPRNHNNHTKESTSMMRCLFYLYQSILEDDERVQRKGIITIQTMQGFGIHQLDRNFPKVVECMNGFPARVTAYHMCYAPLFIMVLWRVVAPILPSIIRKRVHFHGGSKEQVLRRLGQQWGVPIEKLPKDMGGPVVIDPAEWFEQRRRAGL